MYITRHMPHEAFGAMCRAHKPQCKAERSADAKDPLRPVCAMCLRRSTSRSRRAGSRGGDLKPSRRARAHYGAYGGGGARHRPSPPPAAPACRCQPVVTRAARPAGGGLPPASWTAPTRTPPPAGPPAGEPAGWPARRARACGGAGGGPLPPRAAGPVPHKTACGGGCLAAWPRLRRVSKPPLHTPICPFLGPLERHPPSPAAVAARARPARYHPVTAAVTAEDSDPVRGHFPVGSRAGPGGPGIAGGPLAGAGHRAARSRRTRFRTIPAGPGVAGWPDRGWPGHGGGLGPGPVQRVARRESGQSAGPGPCRAPIGPDVRSVEPVHRCRDGLPLPAHPRCCGGPAVAAPLRALAPCSGGAGRRAKRAAPWIPSPAGGNGRVGTGARCALAFEDPRVGSRPGRAGPGSRSHLPVLLTPPAGMERH